jgi:hypothetical protein
LGKSAVLSTKLRGEVQRMIPLARIQVLEEKVAALERQLAEQPNIDQIAIEIEKRFVQQLQVRGTSE